MKRLVVATRKSPLALAQARAFRRELERVTGVSTEELHVTTTGDRVQNVALSEIGGKGLFIKEIEEALLDRRADIAVHSMKDVPGELAPTLAVGCIPAREDPRDAVVTRTGVLFEALPSGSKVGTSSLRRRSMLHAWRPDLEFLPIRGNVDTRLRRCAEGAVDAVVLAMAGLCRLGLAERATEALDPSRCLPAVGQGALGIEHRADDGETAALLARLSDSDTSLTVLAERGVLTAVEGSCQVPVAAYAVRAEGGLWLRAMLADPDGTNARSADVRASWPSSESEAFAIGVDLGGRLKAS